jgi:hypothetical protein
MAEKVLSSRIIHKHDVAANWSKATNFIPKQGELIVYDIDADYAYERIKIGDGTRNVNTLPFVDDALRTVLVEQINAVDDKIDAVSALVGDTAVSEQIAAANVIHVGPTEPDDPNIQVWINTAEEGTGIIPVLPRIATITLAANGWTGSSAPYSQSVEIATVTAATKIDLQPTVDQIVSLQNDDIALMAQNNAGVVTVYAFGDKPSTSMTMQVQLVEVSYL